MSTVEWDQQPWWQAALYRRNLRAEFLGDTPAESPDGAVGALSEEALADLAAAGVRVVRSG